MSGPSIASADDVLTFWRAAGPDKWFEKEDGFDSEIRARFLTTYEAAVSGALAPWEMTADGALALCVVLDQFPRNMFRDSARSFAADPLARAVADRALMRGFDPAVEPALRGFFYLPFMHAENLADQVRCIALYRTLGDADGIKFAEIHAAIIRRFGRFPHRNKALQRATMADEQVFLDAGGFAG
jgi:uncharacterized protein (DUF924 family)